MDYFDLSQKVRTEIETASALLDVTKSAFDCDVKEFSFGGTVNLFYIGKLSSGLHVALRAYRPDMPEGQRDLDFQVFGMEIFCQNAEYLHSQGKGVPAFCVGVTYDGKAGILTEDLTANGQLGLDHHPDKDYGFVGEGGDRRKVFVDIDFQYRWDRNTADKFFLSENRINL